MNSEFIREALIDACWSLPFLTIWIVGLSISFRNRSNAPQIATPAFIAFILLILDSVFGVFYSAWRTTALSTLSTLTHGALGSYAWRIGVFSGLRSLLNLAAWVLLVLCIRRAYRQGNNAVA